jgi:hypothetical protein
MKVRMVVTVDVDPAEWHAEYGVGSDLQTVRDDVKTYFTTHIQAAWAIEPCSLTVNIR